MKSVVIGGSGQVGGWLLKRGRERGHSCLGTSFRHGKPGLVPLDIQDAGAVRNLIREHRPEVVFLPAAMTFVDFAETHPEECRAINVDGTANVARGVAEYAGLLVLFSTEHVFKDSPQPYSEDALPSPCNVYAQSKVEGERVLHDLLPEKHLILRTSWVYGPEEQRKNFVYRAVSTLRKQEKLMVPRDQYGQPTYSPDLAETAWDLAARGQRGTFHVVGPAHLHRLAFALLIAEVFAVDPGGIQGVATDQMGQPAPRPLFICLKRDKLVQTLGRDPIRHPRQALESFRDGPESFRP